MSDHPSDSTYLTGFYGVEVVWPEQHARYAGLWGSMGTVALHRISAGRPRADWCCDYCRTIHPPSLYQCPNCGAGRAVGAAVGMVKGTR